MTSYFEALKDLLFPPVCLSCEQRLESSRPPLFCTDCLAQITFLSSPCCSSCGVPFPSGVDHLCGDCLNQLYAFDFARSLVAYQSPLSSLILSLKFGGHLAGLASLRALTGVSPCATSFSVPDCVLPVPLHVSRLRQRGFNQALVLAKACFPHWQSLIRTDVLIRNRQTVAQSHLTGGKRRTNLCGVFALRSPDAVRGKRILLVDDVFTTGSTVNECSKVLRSGGAIRVEVFTVARSLVG